MPSNKWSAAPTSSGGHVCGPAAALLMAGGSRQQASQQLGVLLQTARLDPGNSSACKCGQLPSSLIASVTCHNLSTHNETVKNVSLFH
jgi:hypothetical protein